MKRAVLAVMMVAALAIRFYGLDQSIVRFHPTRHYRSAVLARACYADHHAGVAPWAKAVSDANRVMQPVGELPVMEWLACGAYLWLGHENVAIPRAIAAVVWVAGAVPVWLLATRLASPLGASLAVALYLFLPYGIVASRNFQPDPLMTFVSLWALVALVRYHDDHSQSRFVAAAVVVGIAGLIKPMSVFLTVPALLACAGALTLRTAGLLVSGLVLPASYYGYSAIAGTLVHDQMRLRFEPHLVTTWFFWRGLANMAARVETLPFLGLAVIGAIVAPTLVARRLLLALFAGYAAFAVAFTYHMPTHDYYHLPYTAVVALGVAVLAARFEPSIPKRARTPAAFALCAVMAVGGSVRAWPGLRVDNADTFARIYEEIGALTGHDTRVLFLDTEYGYALMYHAQISGDAWPNREDLAAEAFDGRAPIDAERRFVRDYADWGPHYFIATDLGSFDASPDLQAMLAQRASPIGITDRYRVYRFKRNAVDGR